MIIAARAIEGPNGIGIFLPCPRIFNTTMPTIMPITAATKSVKMVCIVPSTRPSKKNNLISPPPIPPLDRTAIQYNMPKPTTAPTILSHQGDKGEITRPKTSNGKKNTSTLSGISIYAKSDTTIMMTNEINNSATKKFCTKA